MKTLITCFVLLISIGQATILKAIDFSPNHTIVLCGANDVFFVCLSPQAVDNIWWDFGDGTTATGINAVHRYTDEGVYDVTMTVEVDGVKDSLTKTAFITVHRLPSDSFAVGYDMIHLPFVRLFTYLGDTTLDTIVSYRWKVNNELVSTQGRCKFRFPENGLYTVSLEVTNTSGCSVVRDLVVEINDTPIPQTALSETEFQPYACTFVPGRNQLLITRTQSQSLSEPLTVRLFDIMGRLLNTYVMSASATQLEINLGSDIPGVVVVELATKSFESVSKIHPSYL